MKEARARPPSEVEAKMVRFGNVERVCLLRSVCGGVWDLLVRGQRLGFCVCLLVALVIGESGCRGCECCLRRSVEWLLWIRRADTESALYRIRRADIEV